MFNRGLDQPLVLLSNLYKKAQFNGWDYTRTVTGLEGFFLEIVMADNEKFKNNIALIKAGYLVYVINPLITKRYAISGIRKTKTDAVDAKLLSLIGLLES